MTDTKTMTDVADKAVDKLSAGVEALAKGFQKIAPHAWEVMVRQQVVDGALSLFAAVAFCLVCYRGFKKTFPKWKMGEYDVLPNGAGLLSIAFAVGLGVGALALTFGFSTWASQIFNPEYYAAKALSEMVK